MDGETGKQINVRSPVPQAVSSTDKLHRPSLRQSTRRSVYEPYTRLPDGSYMDDGGNIVKGPVHLAHRYGWENRRLLRVAKELGVTQKQLSEYVNDPRRTRQFFELQNAKDNMGHRFEKPGIDDLEIIKEDMQNFLKTRSN